MKILITGANGQLGNELNRIVNTGASEIGPVSETIKNATILNADIAELDITKLSSVEAFLANNPVDVIINCAAYTNVDRCEEDIDNAYKVNAIGPRNLAMVAKKIGAKFIHVSTDYVFDGEPRLQPLREYDATAPVSVYGTTKLQGENFVKEFCDQYFIVRTAWLYGYVGNNFVYTMMKLGKEKESLQVVNDQMGNPTHANDLAHHLLLLAESEEYGTYHCTNEGECSWFDFASKIMELEGLDCKVNPCTSAEFVRPAKRPAYSSLDNMMLRCSVGNHMRPWQEALESFVKNKEKNND